MIVARVGRPPVAATAAALHTLYLNEHIAVPHRVLCRHFVSRCWRASPSPPPPTVNTTTTITATITPPSAPPTFRYYQRTTISSLHENHHCLVTFTSTPSPPPPPPPPPRRYTCGPTFFIADSTPEVENLISCYVANNYVTGGKFCRPPRRLAAAGGRRAHSAGLKLFV